MHSTFADEKLECYGPKRKVPVFQENFENLNKTVVMYLGEFV